MQNKLFTFCGLDEQITALARIYGQPNICSRALGEWLASAEFDALPSYLTCMAAAAGSSVRFEDIPNALVPRLRGIVKYVHTLNSGMFSGLYLLGTVCNQAKIPLLLLEDTALYMCYASAPQRHLWQVCVGVHTTQYEDVLQLAEQCGFAVERHPYAAVARQGITTQIVIRPTENDSYLWTDTIELKRGNAVFVCPRTATMLIEACQRTFRALTKPDPAVSVMRWCMDMKILLEHLSDTDWARANEIAQSEHAQCHIRFLLAVYTAITGTELEGAALFGTHRDVKRTFRLLQAYAACPKEKQKLRRLFLLYRLRRPDSIIAATALLTQRIWRKLKG